MNNRRIFFIAGMHRSGTSYLAQSLSILGLEIPASAHPGAYDNPKGYFESLNIANYHDRLLKDQGLSWDTFVPINKSWFSSEYSEKAIADLIGHISQEFPGNGPILLKDPRLSMLLPLWTKIVNNLSLQAFVIIPIRNPFEVSASLSKRNNIGKSQSLLTWLNYLFCAEKFSRGKPRSFLYFPDWVENFKATISRLELDLGTTFPMSNEKNVIRAEKEFEKSFVHHNLALDNKKVATVVEDICVKTLGQFLRLIKNPSDKKTLAQVDRLRDKFEEYTSYYAVELLTRLAESESKQLKLEKQLSESQSYTVELKALNSSLNKEYELLAVEYNKQKLTVIRPIWRNIYKATGSTLRKVLPGAWVETLKRISPNPDGVPKRLTYKPQVLEQVAALPESLPPVTFDSNPDVFVLSIINWDFRYQRPQHIAKGLAEAGHRVFYVEMEPAASGLELSKISDSLFRARLSRQKLAHIQPYTGQPDPDQVKRWVAAFYELCETIGTTAFKQIIIQHPFWWQLAMHLPPEFRVTFDCMDDISGFSNTEQFLLDLEHDLLKKCDNLLVSSQYLFDKYQHYQTPVLIRNAAEYEHFSQMNKDINRPAFLDGYLPKAGAKSIKVGYVGAIAEWFDFELIKEVAQTEPAFEFHLCGAVTASGPAKLDNLGNIHFHGEIPYTDVPGFLHEMDVLIIPFKITPIIQACDPVKFYEYSAIGKPTVSTHLPELSRVGDLAFFARTALEFSEQIHNAHKKGKALGFKKQLQQYAFENTWRHRIEQFERNLKEMPKVSVIILSFGDPELTKESLHSLYESGPSYPNLEVIIVDNGSSADAVHELKNFAAKLPGVSIIENGENLGFAKGNNIGLDAATGEFVMLLNNDTVVASGAIYAMTRHLSRNPTIGVIGPLTNNIGNEAKLFVEYENMTQMKDIARQVTTGYRGLFTTMKVAAYFAVMFRRRDLDIFGLLPVEYGLGMFEDDDHCALINSKGFVCALAEDAYVHHHLSATFSKLKDGEKEMLFENNRKIFEEKWGAWEPHEYRVNRPDSTLM